MIAEITKFSQLTKKEGGREFADPREIHVDPTHNPRDYRLKENLEHVEDLKRSIQARGILMPLLVRFDQAQKRLILVDGESKLRATMELINSGMNIKRVPVQEVTGTESDWLVTALTANEGKRLTKWEMGEAFRRLRKMGWLLDDISRETGQTERYVREAIELSEVPDEVKAAMGNGTVSHPAVLAEVRKVGPDNVMPAVQNMVREAEDKGVTVKRYKTRAVNLKKMTASLLKDVTREELLNEELTVIGVDRKKLLQMARTLGMRNLKEVA